MKSIPQAVEAIIRADEVAWQALQADYLTLNEYARQIQARVEDACWKPARPQTIVVALSRLKVAAQAEAKLKLDVKLQSLSVQSGLTLLSYDVTPDRFPVLTEATKRLQPMANTLHATTFGDREVTYILPYTEANVLQRALPYKAKNRLDSVVGVTVRLPETQLREPNLIYTILSGISVRRVDVLEIISTYSELTVLVHEQQLDTVLHAFRAMME